MKLEATAFVWLAFSVGVFAVSGQQSPTTPYDPRNPLPDFVYRNDEKRDALERDIQRGDSNIDLPESGLRRGREDARRRKISAEEQKRIEVLIAPNPLDAARYSTFLKARNTGLTRLIPKFDCRTNQIIYVEGDCAGYVPNGWIYSFREDYYAASAAWSDLRLDGKNLIADGFLTQGILVELGDIELDELNPESDGIKYLSEFVPGATLAEAKTQTSAFKNGVESDGFRYSNSTSFSLNSTYALRSIAYKSKRKVKFEIKNGKPVWSGDPGYSGLSSDVRKDVLIVFRVIREEENGGITLLWKEILRNDAPELLIAKNEKPTDIR